MEHEFERIQKLKVNVFTSILPAIIENERKIWRPKTKVIEGPVNHGSKAGDVEPHTLYWDPYNYEWTNKERAFRGNLFRKLVDVINKKY